MTDSKHRFCNSRLALRLRGTTALLLLGSVAVLSAPLQAQVVYKIIGPDGKVTFTDKPNPNGSQTKGMTIVGKNPNDNLAQLPYDLRQAAIKYPVVLYTSKECSSCDAARSLLMGRGVPFTEYTINTNQDIEAYKRITGSDTLPTAMLGGQRLTGFSNSSWTSYLDAAGYPGNSLLPRSYKYPAPTPLAPSDSEETKVKPKADAAPADSNKTPAAPANPAPAAPPAAANPAGITF